MNAHELVQALRTLANRWALLARDYSRETRESKDEKQAAYYRGFAEGYYKAATELATLLKGNVVDAETVVVNPEPERAAQPETPADESKKTPAPPNVTYVPVALGEVLSILEFVGASPRDVNVVQGNAIHAVFSRWQPFTEHERVAKIAGADPRIIILGFGKAKDTGDPYVEFAFKQT